MAFMNAGFGARFAPVRLAAFLVAFFAVDFFAADFFMVFLAAFFAVVFFAAFLAVDFLAVDFFIVFFAAFFAVVLRPADFRAADFLAGAFFAAFFGAALFAAGFLAAAFLPDFFVRAIDGLRQRVSLVRRNKHLSGAHQNESLSLYTQQENLRGCVCIAYGDPPRTSFIASRDVWKGPPRMTHGLPASSRKAALDEREAHVWRVALDDVFPYEDGLVSCLSPEERMRSAQFLAPLERRRFILSRIVLRHVLAGYHGGAAADVPLAREAGGRPFVQDAEGLFFSLSHSGGVALIAVADVRVGIDVERVRPVPRAAGIARRVMHPETVAVLESLPQAQLEAAFLDAWTQREAHVKALGGGLFRTADELPFDPLQPDDATVRMVASRIDGSAWSVARFRPWHAVRAALASPSPLRSIRIMEWSQDMSEEER
jgi:4'-phosphopantetheinyl transferase